MDLQDYEPYTNGQVSQYRWDSATVSKEYPGTDWLTRQYPYLIRLILWAKEIGLSANIDLHGLPGSQNGQDNSGLTGVVQFAANSSNTDRAVNVLRNLSSEFSRDVYGGVVKSEYL